MKVVDRFASFCLLVMVLIFVWCGAALGEYDYWKQTGIHQLPRWARVNP